MENVEDVIQDVGATLGAQNITWGAILRVFLLLLVGWLVIRFLSKMVERMVERSKLANAAKVYISSALRIFLWLLLGLMLAETLGIKATSIIAMLSVAGLAVSLALQNTLANLAGGLVLLVTKPFTLGDYVEADGISGTIAAINMVYTTFVTPDNREIFIPNSQLSAAKIINYNVLGKRRMDLKFTASYDAPTAQVRAALQESIAKFPQVLADPAPAVYVSEYQASSIEYLARLWTSSSDYWDVYYALMEDVRESFARHGVEMTYNHLNVHISER
ncbi:mechanosensitive ion channel family protein [Pseudoflavonifractor sp. 60]|uniref:mechanosensitive ion channel family protein n=1 Tax=Pseudoflavonifractor sp. 60 TaxID=2304576 RepID=UPI001367C851|nr:mechanosensitive ion channel family protein [Pseudoflavonifractor sp. 60]NBI66222.1 mechanosensitive ion channel family protein [Pseudoflavonifractor sp. 60]